MKCPSFAELPAQPEGKTGWPWIEESLMMPDRMVNGEPWPRVTVVTPSFNQAQFIEETIRSVLLQGYPNLEYIIMDGGSTDGSLEIIKKYSPWLAHWESEKDRGQSHAINKGWQRASGEVLAWINSDDVYKPDAIHQAVEAIITHTAGMVYSDCAIINNKSEYLRDLIAKPFDIISLFTNHCYIPQPTVFLRRDIFNTVGWLDEDLHMVMDLDLWLRIGLREQTKILYLSGIILANFREHSTAKTQAKYELIPLEQLRVWDRVFNNENIPVKLASMRALAYGQLYFIYAVHMVHRGQGTTSLRYLFKALWTHPKYVIGRPLLALAILKRAVLNIIGKNPD